MSVPPGLVKCPVCSEYRGTVKGSDLTWEVQDELQEAMAQFNKAEVFTVSCLCDGIPCPRCRVNKIHRPISNTYIESKNTVEHWPYLSGMIPCRDCRRKEKERSAR